MSQRPHLLRCKQKSMRLRLFALREFQAGAIVQQVHLILRRIRAQVQGPKIKDF